MPFGSVTLVGEPHAGFTSVVVTCGVREPAPSGSGEVVVVRVVGIHVHVEDVVEARIERHVESSGMSWTHLRPNFFMQIFAVPPLVGQLQVAHSLRVPAADHEVRVRGKAGHLCDAALDGMHPHSTLFQQFLDLYGDMCGGGDRRPAGDDDFVDSGRR